MQPAQNTTHCEQHIIADYVNITLQLIVGQEKKMYFSSPVPTSPPGHHPASASTSSFTPTQALAPKFFLSVPIKKNPAYGRQSIYRLMWTG